jgi:hypothetical protein
MSTSSWPKLTKIHCHFNQKSGDFSNCPTCSRYDYCCMGWMVSDMVNQVAHNLTMQIEHFWRFQRIFKNIRSSLEAMSLHFWCLRANFYWSFILLLDDYFSWGLLSSPLLLDVNVSLKLTWAWNYFFMFTLVFMHFTVLTDHIYYPTWNIVCTTLVMSSVSYAKYNTLCSRNWFLLAILLIPM